MGLALHRVGRDVRAILFSRCHPGEIDVMFLWRMCPEYMLTRIPHHCI